MVSFRVSSSGGLASVRVARSSGDPAIDRASIAGVQRATPFPRPPEGLTDAERTFQISVRFR